MMEVENLINVKATFFLSLFNFFGQISTSLSINLHLKEILIQFKRLKSNPSH